MIIEIWFIFMKGSGTSSSWPQIQRFLRSNRIPTKSHFNFIVYNFRWYLNAVLHWKNLVFALVRIMLEAFPLLLFVISVNALFCMAKKRPKEAKKRQYWQRNSQLRRRSTDSISRIKQRSSDLEDRLVEQSAQLGREWKRQSTNLEERLKRKTSSIEGVLEERFNEAKRSIDSNFLRVSRHSSISHGHNSSNSVSDAWK